MQSCFSAEKKGELSEIETVEKERDKLSFCTFEKKTLRWRGEARSSRNCTKIVSSFLTSRLFGGIFWRLTSLLEEQLGKRNCEFGKWFLRWRAKIKLCRNSTSFNLIMVFVAFYEDGGIISVMSILTEVTFCDLLSPTRWEQSRAWEYQIWRQSLGPICGGGGNQLPKCWSMLCGQGISEKKTQGMHFVTPPLVRAISSFNLPIPRWPYATPTDSPFKGKRKTPSRDARMAFSRKKNPSFLPDNYGNRTCAILLGAIVTVRYSTQKNNPNRSQFH